MPKKTNKQNKFWEENKRLIALALILCLISVSLILLQPVFTQLIKQDPMLNAKYLFVMSQLNQLSFFWLFIISFLGALVIFPLAVDFVFVFYIISGANPIYTIFACFTGVVLGRIADYWFGYLFSDYVIKKVIHKDIKKFQKDFSKWEAWLIIIGHFIPFFPLEPLAVFLGSVKYDFWKFLLYTCIGKIIKLILIVLFFKYFFTYGIEFMAFNFVDLIKMVFNFRIY